MELNTTTAQSSFKFKELIRKDNKLYIKICKIPVCKIEFIDKIRKIKYFGGLLYICYNKISLEFNFRICGFSLFRRKNTDSLKYKALYARLKKKNLLYRYVYIFAGSPSGELYIVLNLIKRIIGNIPLTDILFVVDRKFKKNLCCLYIPDIKCVIEKDLNLYVSKKSEFVYKNIKFYSIFTTEHYLKQDKDINSKNIHYYDYILKDLGLKNTGEAFKLPKISDEAHQKVKNYIDKNNLGNFVIISSEANTSSGLSREFWQIICKELEKNQYKVFQNIMKTENYIENCYINYFKYDELIELAKYSKGIIGLRSGLIEIISTLNIPIYCFYSSFPQRGELRAMSSKKAMIGFTLNKLPGVNSDNIYEYDINKITEKELINNVMSQFKKKPENKSADKQMNIAG